MTQLGVHRKRIGCGTAIATVLVRQQASEALDWLNFLGRFRYSGLYGRYPNPG